MNAKVFLSEIDIGKDKVSMSTSEFKRLSELASYQVAVKVKIEQYSATTCPKCEHELSQHITDGYYRVNKVKVCPNCGQLLCWD